MKKQKERVVLFTVAALFLCNLYVWGSVFQTAAFRITFLDIGQGDAVFIETPQGNQILVDTGSGQVILEKLQGVMRAGDRELDLLILTHPDADHIGGAPFVLENYDVGLVLMPSIKRGTGVFERTDELLAKNKIPVLFADAPQRITWGQAGAYVDILHPAESFQEGFSGEINDLSVVSMVVVGAIQTLLTGDITRQVETKLIEQSNGIKATILKIEVKPPAVSRFLPLQTLN